MQDYIKKPESQSRTLDSNPKVSRQAPIDVILQRYGERSIQQYADNEDLTQGEFESATICGQKPMQREDKPNNIGVPDTLKAGIENLFGYTIDDGQIHYNSSKSPHLQPPAYVQEITLGQEEYLPHEAWHGVQQKQRRVQPTLQILGVSTNDNKIVQNKYTSNNIIQRTIKIGDVVYGSYSDVLREEIFKYRLYEDSLNGKKANIIVFLLKIYNLKNMSFIDQDEFREQLDYDIEKLTTLKTDSIGQPQYLLGTDYWRKKSGVINPRFWESYVPDKEKGHRTLEEIVKNVGPQLLAELQSKGQHSSGQLSLFRTMEKEEAKAIMEWYTTGRLKIAETFITEQHTRDEKSKDISLYLKPTKAIIPIGGHMGDKEQALTYSSSSNVTLEFVLKEGAHLILFNPYYMAIARKGGGDKVNAMIAKYKLDRGEGYFPAASLDQANKPGYIGMNTEGRGAFSLTLGDAEASHLLFQLFIDKIKIIQGDL